MESIEIKNFGPIKHVKLDLKDINVFIGTTASGKSTVAKLVAIARDFSFVSQVTFDLFIEYITKYNIDFDITDKTYVKYCNGKFHWELKNKNLESNGANLLLSLMVVSLGQMTSWLHDIKNPNKLPLSEEKIKTFYLCAFLLSDSLDEYTKMEYGEESKDLPRQTQHLLAIASEYKNQFNASNIKSEENTTVLNELLGDSRLQELLPLIDTNIFPDQVTYIPAERNLLSTIGQSIFGLMSNNVTIAESIKDFGSEFETARKRIKQIPISFLDVEYRHIDNKNVIVLSDDTEIKLEQASSGFQSIIPLLLVITAKADKKGVFNKYFIIEEPELNLYPTVQKDLIDFVVERINQSNSKLIITTHSPYILTALDNLIQAHNTAQVNSETEEKVKKLVPPERWVAFDRVACYYFKDGKCESTLDEEYRSIGPSNIDDVSEEIGHVYDQLLKLKYADVL